MDITYGVPQGLVLGPLLFLIYINDLPKSSKFLSFYLFADDTNIYFESDNLATLAKKVNNELRKVKSWLNCNKLALNSDKTNFILFHSDIDWVNFERNYTHSNTPIWLSFGKCINSMANHWTNIIHPLLKDRNKNK